MLSMDRRMGFRVPVEMFVTQYVRDRPFRGLVENLSETGFFLNRVNDLPSSQRVVALEFELPDTGETIWARGEVCHQKKSKYFQCDGIRFTGMARAHARLLRDFCIETRKSQLGSLLARIRDPLH
jgi:hypothetical protein